jgi:N-acetylglucosamine kinase-like BadF-type ATPase
MILIADSGSTKTEWSLIAKDNDIRNFQTIGFNPYFIDSHGIETELEKNLLPFVNEKQITQVFFYGSGCSSLQKKDIIREPLESFFRLANVEVEHDLLAAARSLCGTESGIACILGTGSNSCLYNGSEILENVESVGYMFGDEGAGVYIGKALISYYLRNELPLDLRQLFEQKYPFRFNHILDAVYKQAFPNRFLASFSIFLAENISHSFIYQIIADAFDKFFLYQISHYTNYKNQPLSCTGSVGYYYQDIFRAVAKKWNVNVKIIEKTPMNGLIKYHTK